MTAYTLMLLLMAIHMVCIRLNIHDRIIYQYGASALFILQGETYRAITALFLHADARHLLGNMAGILLFAAPVITLSGYGIGCFILLFAGTLGNLFNAYLYRTAHLSIGASTMIMAAAGLLAAFQFTIKRPFRFNNLFPVFAGALLVALFSHGERTDVWAHLFGFICGLFAGIFFFPLNRTLRVKHKNKVFLVLTLTILVAAIISGAH
jgi:membrane associated rhomboid family serine protease